LFLTIRLASLNIAASARLSRPEPWVIASTGVAQYITIGAMSDTLRQAAGLARGTVFVSRFVPPADLIDPAERHLLCPDRTGGGVERRWISFYTPREFVSIATKAGFDKRTTSWLMN